MTRKLLTPIQYESVLGSLDKARPLSLVDEGRVVLSDPVLNSITVNDNRPAKGKFLRSNHGSSPKFNPNCYSGYHYYTREVSADETYPLEFACDPAAQGILLNIYLYTYPCWFDWYSYDFLTFIKRYSPAGAFWIPYTGEHFRFRMSTGGPGALGIKLYGFYGKDI